jgi:hypothetical protein
VWSDETEKMAHAAFKELADVLGYARPGKEFIPPEDSAALLLLAIRQVPLDLLVARYRANRVAAEYDRLGAFHTTPWDEVKAKKAAIDEDLGRCDPAKGVHVMPHRRCILRDNTAS